jgi:ferredoxin
MSPREIVEIDEAKCNGCGQCIPKCAEGALQIINGKARLVGDQLCDGLGACVGHCPQGALRIVRKTAAPFDAAAVDTQHHRAQQTESHACECSHVVVSPPPPSKARPTEAKRGPKTWRQWPLALRLVPVSAPFFKDANLLVAADCAPFAYARFHEDFLRDKVLVFGCPKFDDARGYVDKLADILRSNSIKTLTLVHMEVPCCSGLRAVLEAALAKSGKKIPLQITVLTTSGERRT